ncbi:aminoglycoside 3-N-acetyltransferase [Martelella sp. FLE1502]
MTQPPSRPATAAEITRQFSDLGVRPGDLLMVHASLRSVGPVEGGADALLHCLLSAVGPGGTLMGYASWDRSPYEETLNGATLADDARSNWPAFNPVTADVYPGFGMFNALLADQPGARRSAHPDASMVAVGPLAATLIAPHALGDAFGPRSPIERFIAHNGKVLLLGVPLDAVTALHYAEAVADIPDKRRVTYEMPLLGADGLKHWHKAEDWDTNGILDCYAIEGQTDAVERIARDYVATHRPPYGKVGNADCFLFPARDIVDFGIAWLENRHATR